MARMNQPDDKFKNVIIPLPYDLPLPKFIIPTISQELPPSSSLIHQLPPNLVSDPFIGIDLQLQNLSTYSNNPTEDDFNAHDILIVPELDVSVTESILIPVIRTEPLQKNQKRNNSKYEKSGFFDESSSDEIQKQLECAFCGEVPQGKVLHLKPTAAYHFLQVRGNGKLPLGSILLMDSKAQYLKVVDQKYNEVTSGFQIESSAKNFAYIIENEKGVFFAPISKYYQLNELSKKQLKKNIHTSRGVQFIDEI